MKTPRLRIAFFALALVGAVIPDAAASTPAAPQPEKAPEWAELFGGAPLPVVWQSAQAAAARIAAALPTGNLTGVAEWAETVHLAAHALDDQVKLGDAERQRRLRGALGQAARLADDVIDAAKQQQVERLGEAFRRLQAALALAARRLPPEIVNAPPQPVRSVPPAAPGAGGQGAAVRK